VAGIVLCGGSIVAWNVGSALVGDVKFARAAQEIEATRQQLANVQDLANVYKAVNKVVEPSVVSIEVHKTVKNPHRDQQQDDLLKRFFPDRDGDGEPDVPEGFRGFNLPNTPDEYDAFGTGSGVIMEVDGNTGYIVTNNHVAGGATEMTITLSDGREIKDAKLLGSDAKSDLAVVKIQADHLSPAKWGNSDYLEKGDIIMAFGSPLGYVGSMTHGIVSALNRNAKIIRNQFAYESFIQVDAPINPGNSGGPLVNTRGEVVGINTAIATRTGGFQGIGFAIPSNNAKFVYNEIKEKGKVVRGWLGIEIADVAKVKNLARQQQYDGDTGVFVQGVTKSGPSDKKLQPGDVITAINGKNITNMDELRNMIAQTPPATDAKFTVMRNGKPETVSLKIGEQPEDLRSFLAGKTGGTDKGEVEPGSPRTASALGMKLSDTSDELAERFGLESTDGALVSAIEAGSIAQLSGMQPGDLINRINGQPVHNAADAKDLLAKADLKKGVRISVTNKEGSRMLFLQGDIEK
jgi:serine protease Do